MNNVNHIKSEFHLPFVGGLSKETYFTVAVRLIAILKSKVLMVLMYLILIGHSLTFGQTLTQAMYDYGENNSSYHIDVDPLGSGNYLIANLRKLMVVNSAGQVQYAYDMPAGTGIIESAILPNGDIVVLASDASNGFVFCINQALSTIHWQVTCSTQGSITDNGITVLSDGNVLSWSAFESTKINSTTGAVIWARSYTFLYASANRNFVPEKGIELANGNIVFIGLYTNVLVYYLVDGNTGAPITVYTFNSNYYGNEVDAVLGADGFIYVYGIDLTNNRGVIYKLNTNGTFVFGRSITHTYRQSFGVGITNSIEADGIVIGVSTSQIGTITDPPNQGLALSKINYSGASVWSKVYGLASGYFFRGRVNKDANGYILTSSGPVAKIIKTNSSGEIPDCDDDINGIANLTTVTLTRSSTFGSSTTPTRPVTNYSLSASSASLVSTCPATLPQPPEICTNGIDDDGDGLVDCLDSDCPVCVEICKNGIDDDGDGLVDCLDSDCLVCVEICNNGIDDDGDGLVDCDDPDCQATFTPGNYTYRSSGTFPAQHEFYGTGLTRTTSGTFLLSGGVTDASSSPTTQKFAIVEVDGNGALMNAVEWDHNLGSVSSGDATSDIIELSDGSRVTAFSHYDLATSQYTTKIIKLSTTNAVIWAYSYSGIGYTPIRLHKLPDGNLILLTGSTLLKLNSISGTLLFQKSVGAREIAIASDGIVCVTLNGGAALYKLDFNGNVIASCRITLPFTFAPVGFIGLQIAVDEQDDVYFSYTSRSNATIGGVVKVNNSLTAVLWTRQIYVNTDFNYMGNIVLGNDNTSIVVSSGMGNGSVGLTKLDKNTGATVWVVNGIGIEGFGKLIALGGGYAYSAYDGSIGAHVGNLVIVDENGNIPGASLCFSSPTYTDASTPATYQSFNVSVSDASSAIVSVTPNFTTHIMTQGASCASNITIGNGCDESCDKIPNVAYVLSVDEVDPMANNNRDNADLKLGSCTCDLNPIAYEVQCNNNGTPNNPADDTYTITNFIVTAAAGGGAGGYNLSGGITATGNAYGTAYSYGPFPISGGPLSVTVTDVNTTSCTRTDQIIPPLTCSNCVVTGTATGDVVCEGESIYLMSSGGDMYSWSGPNGFTSTLQSPVIPNATLAMGGTYTVVVTNTTGGGCTDTKTATVTVNAAPLVTLGADIQTCLDDVTTLTATGCSGALLWNTGESSNTISVSPSQTSAYSVQCTASGCVGKDTIIVYVSDITVKGTPTACKPNSSTHDVSVVVTLVNPPVSGTLTLTIGGMSQVFNAPFTSPITHNFIDLASDGQYHTIQATLSNGASCSESQFYLAPSPCTTCNITSMTATPGTCNPLTNQYILTGTISTSNPPSSGNLIISTNGVATTIPGPFSATINYEITGLVSDGMSHDVTAYFTDDLSCVFSTNYLSPVPCNSITCDISLTRTVGTCDVNNNLYSLQGMVTFTGAPETGTLVVVVEGEGSLTYLPPFVSPISYNFPNLTSDGGTKNVTAYFTGNGACFDEVSYTAPARCGNFNCNIRLSMEVGVCDPNTNTYAVTGEVYINNPPSGGNIIISYPGGQQTVANTGVSPVSFQIPGLPASGGIGEIGVTMSNDLPCYTRSIYEIPGSCGMISLCSISATASASPCDPERNDYTLTGTLTFSNAPPGNIILEIDGITHTITGPVSSPLMYEIPGMPSDGSDHQLLVYFENNANCSNSVTYTAPAVCAPNTCTMSMDLLTGSCQSATNTFSVSGSLTVSNAPASGQLRIWIEGTGFETVINAPFGANIPFSFNNMVSSGLPYDIKASFSADLSCQVRRSFVAPDACLSGGGCEVQVLAAAACTSGATFTVTGMVLIQNAPSSGTMTIRVGTLLQTLSAPFDPMAFIGFSGFPLGTDVPVEITFSADPSCSVITMVDAPQDCNCEVSLGTVSGLCVEGTETHNARGTVTLVNPPLTGTLTISVPGGQSEVFTAPFNSPLYYEVTGLPDGGGSRTVTAAFSADAGCTATQSYTAPVDCPICDIQLPVVQSLSCYNNDTPSKITDNKIRIRLLVTNANPALTTYNLTVNGGTTISPAVGLYGVGTEFTMGPGTAGGGATFIITITDSSGLTCNTAEVTVPDPGNCNNTTECPTIKCGSVIIQVNGN